MINTYVREDTVNGNKVWKTYTDVANLRNLPSNPKEILTKKYADLVHFLDTYGQLMPFLVDTREGHEGELLGGNHSYKGWLDLNKEDAWIELRHPKSDADALQIALVHNAHFAHYLDDMLAEQVLQFKDDLNLGAIDLNLGHSTDLETLLKEYSNEGKDINVVEPEKEAQQEAAMITCPNCGHMFTKTE